MRITSLSRNEGCIGDVVVIRGSGLGFADVGGSVTFNGVLAKPFKWQPDEIQVAVPAGAVTGPLTVAFGGGAAEVQFTVDTIPHGKERTFQAIETGPQVIHRQNAVSAAGFPMASANPEATNSPVPTVPVDGKGGSNKEAIDEDEREKERKTRVIQPVSEGQLVTPAPEVGKNTEPMVISGPQSADPFVGENPVPTPFTEVGKIVAPVVLTKEVKEAKDAHLEELNRKNTPEPPTPIVPGTGQPVGNTTTNQPVADVSDVANPSSTDSLKNLSSVKSTEDIIGNNVPEKNQIEQPRVGKEVKLT